MKSGCACRRLLLWTIFRSGLLYRLPCLRLEGYTFEGFLNDDGSVGTKNILGITTTVQCVAATVDFAVRRIKAELLPRYPNVDDVVAITHNYGCGVAIDAPGAADSDPHAAESQPQSQSRRRADGGRAWAARSCSRRDCCPASTLPILSGSPTSSACRTSSIIASATWSQRDHGDGGEAAGRTESAHARHPCPASDLVVGLQCGGSDAFSGVTAIRLSVMRRICWSAPARR